MAHLACADLGALGTWHLWTHLILRITQESPIAHREVRPQGSKRQLRTVALTLCFLRHRACSVCSQNWTAYPADWWTRATDKGKASSEKVIYRLGTLGRVPFLSCFSLLHLHLPQTLFWSQHEKAPNYLSPHYPQFHTCISSVFSGVPLPKPS